MSALERLRIALRYTFAFGRGHLSTFLSSLSMLGLVLAIGLLIIVLSVMNGFDKEMRERILALVPHVTIYSFQPMSDWRAQADLVAVHPEVREVSPFTEFDALFMRGDRIETAAGVGIAPDDARAVGRLLHSLPPQAIDGFRSDPAALVLGSGLAARLGVRAGDRVTMIVPARSGPGVAGAAQFEGMHLVAVLDTGTELDQALALVQLPLASRVAGLGDAVSGLRVSTGSLFDVARISRELVNRLPSGYYARNWMMTHGNLYAAIQLSRELITILLFSIIAVAAFNVVSSLVLVVFDKQANIAILRTLGARPRDIASIFVLQGAIIGLVGVGLGSAAGAAGSLAVPGVVGALERLLDIHFLDTDVYPVSFLPVDIRPADIAVVGSVAFAMCIGAAIYPALRAARLAPALILNEERN